MGIQKILIVDDETKLANLIGMFLKGLGYDPEVVNSGAEAIEKIRNRNFDLVISDLQIPDLNGIEILTELKKTSPNTLFIMITAYGTAEKAFEASKLGADLFIKKPFDLTELQIAVEKLEESRELRQELIRLKVRKIDEYSLESIIGLSESVQHLKKQVLDASRFSTSVLITGESGTGKELIAKALHYNGPSAERPFIPINCSAIPEQLLESEFFGHVKGSFTGAVNNKKGLFEEANNSTLFLDEIGDLPQHMQAKILRAIQERKIRRVGDTREIEINVKLISATSRNLDELIREGKFREDLYYRINIINIHVPPLRKRTEDIPVLAEHFITKICQKLGIPRKNIGTNALKTLGRYHFPGNVRQLENIMERAIVLTHDDLITEETINDCLPNLNIDSSFQVKVGDFTLSYKDAFRKIQDLFDRQYIGEVMRKNMNNRQKTADELGISLRLLHYKLKNGKTN